MRIVASLLIVSLAVPANGEPIRLQLGWDDMRAVASHAEISPKVVVRLGPDGRKRAKGRLAGITPEGIGLRSSRKDRFVRQGDVHSIRLMPVKGARFKGHPRYWRTAAAVGGVILFFGLYWLMILLPEGLPEGPIFNNHKSPKAYVVATTAPAAVYWLALRADRGRGAIIIELNHETQSGNQGDQL